MSGMAGKKMDRKWEQIEVKKGVTEENYLESVLRFRSRVKEGKEGARVKSAVILFRLAWLHLCDVLHAAFSPRTMLRDAAPPTDLHTLQGFFNQLLRDMGQWGVLGFGDGGDAVLGVLRRIQQDMDSAICAIKGTEPEAQPQGGPVKDAPLTPEKIEQADTFRVAVRGVLPFTERVRKCCQALEETLNEQMKKRPVSARTEETRSLTSAVLASIKRLEETLEETGESSSPKQIRRLLVSSLEVSTYLRHVRGSLGRQDDRGGAPPTCNSPQIRRLRTPSTLEEKRRQKIVDLLEAIELTESKLEEVIMRGKQFCAPRREEVLAALKDIRDKLEAFRSGASEVTKKKRAQDELIRKETVNIEEKIVKLKETTRDAEEEKARLNDELEKQEKAKEDLKEAADRLAQAKSAKELQNQRERDAWDFERKGLEAELKKLRSSPESAEKKMKEVQQLEEDIQRMTDGIPEEEAAAQKAEDRREKARREEAIAIRDRLQAEDSAKKIAEELADLRPRYDELNEAKKAADRKHKDKKNQDDARLMALMKQCADEKKKPEAMRKRNEDLNHRMQNADAEIARMEKDIKEKEDAIARMREDAGKLGKVNHDIVDTALNLKKKMREEEKLECLEYGCERDKIVRESLIEVQAKLKKGIPTWAGLLHSSEPRGEKSERYKIKLLTPMVGPGSESAQEGICYRLLNRQALEEVVKAGKALADELEQCGESGQMVRDGLTSLDEKVETAPGLAPDPNNNPTNAIFLSSSTP